MLLRYILVSVVSFGVSAQSGRVANRRPPSFVPDLWKPPTGTAEEFRRNHGMDRATAMKQKAKVREYKVLVAQKYGRQIDAEDLDEFIGDTLPTLEQIEAMVEQFKYGRNRRFKRAIIDDLTSRWSMPIPFRLDGSQSPSDAAMIREAIAIWESETCIYFQEIDDVTGVGHYILFTSDSSGCWSYIGKVGNPSPQQINLKSPGCTTLIGVPLHEIGHALGFYHEHTRPDRDSFVDILLENVKAGKEANFEIRTDSESYSIPYDYKSVMHYDQITFSIDPAARDTVVPIDATKSNIIGQRAGLSFRDVKLANMAYCPQYIDDCGLLSNPCPGESYLDAQCLCKCPEGIGGDMCDRVADSDPECDLADIPLMASKEVQCIESPNYASRELQPGTTCYWDIQAPAGCTVSFSFTDLSQPCVVFGDLQICYKWVDIWDRDRENTRRFCCHTAPAEAVVSLTNQTIVMLRTDYLGSNSTAFRLCYTLTDPQCAATTTTTTTSTTTVTTPTTTNSAGTTTQSTTTLTPASTTTTTTTTTTPPTTTTTTTTTPPTTTATTRKRRPRPTIPSRGPQNRRRQAPTPRTRRSQEPAPRTRPGRHPHLRP